MKILFLATVLNALALCVCAQDDNTPSPEFINQVYAMNNEKQLQQLEKVTMEIKTKNKVVSAKQMYVIDGASSPVKLNAQQVQFVVSTGGGFAMDPSSQFSLQRFDSKKGSRECVSSNYGGIMSKPKENSAELSISFKQIKEGVYAMVPDKPLEKGEYAFINKTSMKSAGMSVKMDAYAFSIE